MSELGARRWFEPRHYHVGVGHPFKSIMAAARLAQPGDTITVHAGIYREYVNPPRGGTSEADRITYQAAPGEHVVISGAEPVAGWVKRVHDTWEVRISNDRFGSFNPYLDLLHGDWFYPKDRLHHSGAVYLDGHWLAEAAGAADVMQPVREEPLWYATVDDTHTTILAQFPDVDPNMANVEINVRRTVFYPDRPGCNYITVRGFTMRQAATPWAPPTAEQIGLIGTHWSKGWVIENNTVSYSVCAGITLGKHGDEFDNTVAGSAEGYVQTIARAHAHTIPWSAEHIGGHVVRGNHVFQCGQVGIAGSLGCAFSSVTDNVIHEIHVRRPYHGEEMGGIKFHGAIDTEIRRNHIFRSYRGLWLDWMSQGTRVSGNVFQDNDHHDLFLEVNHGPLFVDHNLFLSERNLWDMSQGGAFAHNWFAGRITLQTDSSRMVPFHFAHDTLIAGMQTIAGGGNRFYNNIFFGNDTDGAGDAGVPLPPLPFCSGYGLWMYDQAKIPLRAGGNVYCQGARPWRAEEMPLVLTGRNPKVNLQRQHNGWTLEFNGGGEIRNAETQPVTTALLGTAEIPGLSYENSDGSPLRLDTDFFGGQWKVLMPGPFASPFVGERFLFASTAENSGNDSSAR